MNKKTSSLKKKNSATGNSADLRRRAEDMMKSGEGAGGRKRIKMADMELMLHELQVHQVELELQNQELLRAHLEADEAREKYFDLYDLAPVAYLTLDRDANILGINLTGTKLLGEVRSNLIGRNFKLFLGQGDIPSFNMFLDRMLAGGGRENCELWIENGGVSSQVCARVEGACTDNDGSPECRIVLVDITDRRMAEEALRRSEQRFRTLFEGAAEGIIVADAGTDKFLYANPSICTLFGYSSIELTQLRVADLHPPDSRAAALEAFEKMKNSSIEAIANLSCRRKDGTVFYADVRSSVLEIDGRHCLVGFFTDVSARRAAEEDSIRHIEDLRLKNEELAQFNSVMVDRELRMIELKKQINQFCIEAGREPLFPLVS